MLQRCSKNLTVWDSVKPTISETLFGPMTFYLQSTYCVLEILTLPVTSVIKDLIPSI